MSSARAVVLLSGGLDSTTCLLWAVEHFGPGNVLPISFDYGQRHDVELGCAARILELLEVEQAEVLSMELLRQLGGSSLTDARLDVAADHEGGAIPSSFVPGRNLLFLSAAAAYGAVHAARNIVIGVCEADAAGYPDCRWQFVDLAESAISAALGESYTVHAPLVSKSKAETFALAEQLGHLELVVRETHTCYRGKRDAQHLHPWGHGCGACLACNERAKGWAEFSKRRKVMA